MANTSLSDRIKFERRNGYLHARLECVALTPAVALEALSEIMMEAAAARLKRVMVACNVASIESDFMLMESMLSIASMRSGSKIAFVECQTSSHNHPSLGDDFKIFDDAKSAEAWLLAD